MPFEPKYTITDKILNNISRIMAGREVIEHSRLVPKWELRLKKEARVHNAHSSTSIEGNKLTLEQVTALAENKEVLAAEKDKKEVLNYLKALDSIPEYAGAKAVDVKLFLKIHRTVAIDTLRGNNDCGVFRSRQVFVGRRVFDGTGFKEIVEYMPPEILPKIATENDVPDMDGLKNWLKEKKHPIVDTWKAEPAKAAEQAPQQMQQAPMTGFTVPTLELPASALPAGMMQGLPQGVTFKIILKNAKIKAERVIIRAEKE